MNVVVDATKWSKHYARVCNPKLNSLRANQTGALNMDGAFAPCSQSVYEFYFIFFLFKMTEWNLFSYLVS